MRWFILGAAALGACAPPSPSGQAPPPTLDLTVSDVMPGEMLQIDVTGASPGDRVWVIRGDAAGTGPCPAQLGFCVDVENPVNFWAATADSSGTAQLSFTVPMGAPVGAMGAFQALVIPTQALSGTVERTIVDPAAKPDFALVDVSPTSNRSGEVVSPRDYLESVSGWYFGHSS